MAEIKRAIPTRAAVLMGKNEEFISALSMLDPSVERQALEKSCNLLKFKTGFFKSMENALN
ncbi:MAG TPA: hypothetical protein VFU89_01675 [Rhabdochlamydiaceae bacterium]|nr:hypothetical protein [Rhabdochlamydiaceae bacterium]